MKYSFFVFITFFGLNVLFAQKSDLSNFDQVTFGYTGGNFNTLRPVNQKPLEMWRKWTGFHTTKNVDSILNMVNKNITIQLPNSDVIKGKKAYKELLEKEMASKEIYFDNYWAIPVHALWDSSSSSWTSWRYQYRTVEEGKTTVSKSHAGVYIVDDSIQFIEIISNEIEMVELTFKVDMKNDKELSKKGVYLNGTFNNWCGKCDPMKDEDGDGVFETKVAVRKGEIEYKFTIDGWEEDESFEPQTPGTKTTLDGDKTFTNRVWNTSDGLIIPLVCYNQTSTCD